MKPSGRPGKHTTTSFYDKQAISTLDRILSAHRLVKSYLKAEDSTPNHDGHMEVLDSEGVEIGSIKAQVKSLNPDKIKKKILHTFKDDKFLSYCKDFRDNPIVFIGVDRDNDVAYWREMTPELVKRLSGRTLEVPRQNIISMKDQGYYAFWKKLCEERLSAIKQYKKFKEQRKILSPQGEVVKLKNVPETLLVKSKKKLHPLFISEALKQKYYFGFIDLLEPFYLDGRGEKQRKRLRNIFEISQEQESSFIQKMQKNNLVKVVSALCIVNDSNKAQLAQSEIINRAGISLDEILRLFS